jgi:hypothetical protein
MNLQSKKARIPIAALGVTALIAGAGALTSPASAAGTSLAFGPTDTSATIVNVLSGTNAATAGLSYGLKVTGASGSDPTYLGVITAPTGASLYSQRVPTNGVPSINTTFAGVVDVTPIAVTLTTTAGSTAAVASTAPVPALASALVRIGTGATAEYAVASSTGTAVTLAQPAVSSQAGVAFATGGAAASNNFFVPTRAATSAAVPGYAAGDNIYFGATVPGDYTFRLFQDHNGNAAFESAQDDTTPTFTLHVKDVTGNTASDTSDDLDFGLTTPASVDLGQSIAASATMGGLSTVDTRGVNGSGLGKLGVNLASATNYNGTGTTTTVGADGVATFDGTAFTKSFTTAGAAGSFDLQPEFDVNGSASWTGADFIPTSQKKNTTVSSNGVTALSALAVTAVTGSIKSAAGTATIKPAVTTATYSTTVTDTGTKTDDVVFFTLTSGTNSPVLTSTATLISSATGVKVYSAAADSTGVASITVTSSVTTTGTTYTVAATSNAVSATSLTATFATAVGSTFESTNTAVELNPTVPTSGTGSVVIKGRVLDQYGAGSPTTSSAAVTINIDVNNSSYAAADVTGTAAAASDGTFSYTYTPTAAATAGQSDFIQFTSAGVTTALATASIKWSSSATIASITITAPAAGATAVTLQDNTAPDATQVNGGSPAFGNTTGLVAGTVYDSTSTALAFKAVTLSGGAGVYFATQALPDATHLLTPTLDVVTSSTGTITGAYVFFTKAGTVKVTATAGSVTTDATVTTSAAAVGQRYTISVDDIAGAPGDTLIVTGTVKDLFGNPVPGYDPTLSTGTSTVGSLGDTTPTTNADGVFSTTFLSGSNQSGDVTLTATLTGLVADPTAVAAWLTAGITVPNGDFEETSTITVAVVELTLSSTPKLIGGGTAKMVGTFMPNTGVDIYSKASGAASYSLIDSVTTDADGKYTASSFLKKTTRFLAKSAGLSSPVDTTRVYSKVTLTGKSFSHRRATLSANGSPSAKGTLTFYRSVAGKDPVLKKMTSNSLGNGRVTVTLPRGNRYVYVVFRAPGTTAGKSKIIKIAVK